MASRRTHLAAPAEPDPDETPVDKQKVLTNPLLKKSTVKYLVPIDLAHGYFTDDPKKIYNVVIDVERYQRGRTSKTDQIRKVLRHGGYLPDTKTVVIRPDDTIAVVDGGQTLRALAESLLAREIKNPDEAVLTVRAHTFDNLLLEADLFCVLNDVAQVQQIIQVRAHNGATSKLLRAMNGSAGEPLHNKLWTETGGIPKKGVSPVSLVRALGTAFLVADDKAAFDWSGGRKGAAVLMKTQQTPISDVLAELDPLLKASDIRDRAEEFLARLSTALLLPMVIRKGQGVYDMGRPNFMACQALGLMYRCGELTDSIARKLAAPKIRKQVHAISVEKAPSKKNDPNASNWRRRHIAIMAERMGEMARSFR